RPGRRRRPGVPGAAAARAATLAQVQVPLANVLASPDAGLPVPPRVRPPARHPPDRPPVLAARRGRLRRFAAMGCRLETPRPGVVERTRGGRPAPTPGRTGS